MLVEELGNDAANIGKGNRQAEQQAQSGNQVNLRHQAGRACLRCSDKVFFSVIPDDVQRRENGRRRVGKEGSVRLGLGCSTVVAVVGHSVVAKEEEKRVVGKQLDGALQEPVHSRQALKEERVTRRMRVANVVHTEKVGHDEGPVGGGREVREQARLDAIVHRVQVARVERVKGKRSAKRLVAGKERHPRVVPEKGERGGAGAGCELADPVILDDGGRVEVARKVDKGRKRSRS